MKKEQKIYSLWLLAIPLLFIHCSGQEATLPDGPDTEIRLVADLPLATRSAIGQFKGDTIAFARGTSSGTYSEVWKAKATGGEAHLLKPRFYPADNSPVYLCGYYPAVMPDGSGVLFRLTGREDVLVSNEQSGCLTDMFWQESKRFSFRHLLTQLNIRLRVTADYPVGARLYRLQIDGSRRDALLDLYKRRLLFSGDTGPLAVWQSATENESLPLGTLYPDTLLPPVMAEADVPLTLSVTVRLTGGAERMYPAIPIRFQELDGLPRAGTSYTLSLTLGNAAEEISLSTSVAEWRRGNEGHVAIE